MRFKRSTHESKRRVGQFCSFPPATSVSDFEKLRFGISPIGHPTRDETALTHLQSIVVIPVA